LCAKDAAYHDVSCTRYNGNPRRADIPCCPRLSSGAASLPLQRGSRRANAPPTNRLLQSWGAVLARPGGVTRVRQAYARGRCGCRAALGHDHGIGAVVAAASPFRVRPCCARIFVDLTIVLLRRSGRRPALRCVHVRGWSNGFVSAWTPIPARARHFQAARQSGAVEVRLLPRPLRWALYGAATALPFLVSARAGLGSDVIRFTRNCATLISPYYDGEELLAVPAAVSMPLWVHLPGRHRGHAQLHRGRTVLRRLFRRRRRAAYSSCERSCPPGLAAVGCV